ncbi:unnamed protein product [Heligmosomoides polygyrus]|uniref:AMP-binding domain-containing protein n=1 Tax=Heligmosomoides polygyrus TaxID=6339 RepID=A0A183G5T7_HELPZ|nr:unnamed protein product [Heligmosomoides polygyrus]
MPPALGLDETKQRKYPSPVRISKRGKIYLLQTNLNSKANEKGELCVGGPTDTQGYVNEGNGGVVVDEDGWYHTGLELFS